MAATEEHKSYEDIRLENIRRNELFLQEIGLTSLSNNISQIGRCATAPPLAKRTKRKIQADSNADESSGAKRRSSRLQRIPISEEGDIGQIDNTSTKRRNARTYNEIDYSEYDTLVNDEESERRAVTIDDVRRLIDEMNPQHQKLVKDKILSHCVYRINYMSARAAFTRVKKISGIDKLLATYYCLVCADMIDIAQVAQFALERKGFSMS